MCGLVWSIPGIAQGNDLIENEILGMGGSVHGEVAESFELVGEGGGVERFAFADSGEVGEGVDGGAGFNVSVEGLEGVWVEVVEEVGREFAGLG